MSESRRLLGSDLARVDSHVITDEEYREIPELSEEWFARAEPHMGGKPVRRGRPVSESRKQLLTLRVDPEIIDAYRATGPGWQARMHDALKQSAPGGANTSWRPKLEKIPPSLLEAFTTKGNDKEKQVWRVSRVFRRKYEAEAAVRLLGGERLGKQEPKVPSSSRRPARPLGKV